jgi:hypothetical protein
MFGLRNYERLINNLSEHKFKFSIDWQAHPSSKTILMRHDIDFSVDDALSMALFEEKLNIRSTYFFMLSSNMYNLLSSKNRSIVERIKEMGHIISLHFDPTVYKSLEGFLEERDTFNSAFNVELDIVSIHRPGKFLENNNIDLYGSSHTYQDHYFKELKYLSDSGGRDIFGPLLDFLNCASEQSLHLLIHPVWWVNELPSQTKTLNNWRKKNLKFITSEIRLNCKTYDG